MPRKVKKMLHIELWPGDVTYCGLAVADLDPETDRSGALIPVIMTPPRRFNRCIECHKRCKEAP